MLAAMAPGYIHGHGNMQSVEVLAVTMAQGAGGGQRDARCHCTCLISCLFHTCLALQGECGYQQLTADAGQVPSSAAPQPAAPSRAKSYTLQREQGEQ